MTDQDSSPDAPANKKADDDAIRQFVADSETGVIAPEVATAFDIGKTTAREALSRLEDRDTVVSRKASVIRLFYVPDTEDDHDHEPDNEEDMKSESTPETDDSASDTGHSETVFGDVKFLTADQIEYLRDGTVSEYVEPHVLDRLSERFVEKVWEVPYNDGPDREEMALVAQRLGLSMEALKSMTPSEVVGKIDDRADALREDVDQLYLHFSPAHRPTMDVLREIRRHTLSCTQKAAAERFAEMTGLQANTAQSQLSKWENTGSDPGADRREKLASIYRDLYENNHDPYRNREEWDWPGAEAETIKTPDQSPDTSESDHENDRIPAISYPEQPRGSQGGDDE